MLFYLLLFAGLIFLWRRQTRMQKFLLSRIAELETEIANVKPKVDEKKEKSGQDHFEPHMVEKPAHEKTSQKTEGKPFSDIPPPVPATGDATAQEQKQKEKSTSSEKSLGPPASHTGSDSEDLISKNPPPIPAAEYKAGKQKTEIRGGLKNFSPNVDWEMFAGVKLFAWLGGIALFIGAGFFVKYSIDRNLIPPMVRLVVGALIGAGLILSSFWFEKIRYKHLRQTLAAGGIGVLYTVIFAATIYYEFIPKSFGIGVLSLISAAAFVIAVFQRGIAVSVLGALGAYASPILVSTGPSGLGQLFIYLAIVNLGLFEVMRRLGFSFLLTFSTAGTLITLILGAFAGPSPSEGIFALVWISNLALFSFFVEFASRQKEPGKAVFWTWNILYLTVLFVAAISLIIMPDASILLSSAVMIGVNLLAFRNRFWYSRCAPFSVMTFFLVLAWTVLAFDPGRFSWRFGVFFLYGVAGGIGPAALNLKYGLENKNILWLKAFPLAVTATAMIALFHNQTVNFWFWPMTLLLQMVGILISLIIGALIQVGLLTAVIVAGGIFWINQAPPTAMGAGFFVFLLAAGVLMLAATYLALRHLSAWLPETKNTKSGKNAKEPLINLYEWMKAAPVMGAFVLLGVVFWTQRPLDPLPGMATLTCFTTIALFLGKRILFTSLIMSSLAASALAETTWMVSPPPGTEFSSLIWSSAGFAAALVSPFLFFRPADKWSRVWMAWGLFELFQAVFLFRASDFLWGRQASGCLPAAMAILKLPTVYLLVKQLEGKSSRNAILSFHGGILLLYISSLPVIWFEKGWLGLSLVFETAALLWLNTRIVHPGLRWVSAVAAPWGLILLILNLGTMRGIDSFPVLNEAVIAVALCIPALIASKHLADYPKRKLAGIDLPNYFLTFAIGAGFFLINLFVSDICGKIEAVRVAGWEGYLSDGFGSYPFGAFFGRTMFMATASAAAWFAYGFAMANWPQKLAAPFRIAGMALMLLSVWKSARIPLRFTADFGQAIPFFNPQTLLFLFLLAGLVWMIYQKNLTGWPFEKISSRSFFAVVTGIFGFWVLNIEIASIFGDSHFGFSLAPRGNFSLQLAYSLGWLIFAIGLLVIGIKFRLTRVRWTALIMLAAVAFKIFFQDLWSLGQLYRVTSFVGLAAVLILVSFLYQRCLAKGAEDEN